MRRLLDKSPPYRLIDASDEPAKAGKTPENIWPPRPLTLSLINLAGMWGLRVGVVMVLVTAAGCSAPTPALPPVIDTPVAEESAPETTEDTAVSWCERFDPESREWFELDTASPVQVTSSKGVAVSLTAGELPQNPAGRFNAVAEVCPGLVLILAASGDAHLVATDSWRYSPLPPLEPVNPGDSGAGPGVNGGVPTFGFRDGIVVDQTVFVSDAVIDSAAQCVRVEARSIDLTDWVDGAVADLTTVHAPTTCVSYTDSYRASAPIKTHLGGALAYHSEKDELYMSIGDLHLGLAASPKRYPSESTTPRPITPYFSTQTKPSAPSSR